MNLKHDLTYIFFCDALKLLIGEVIPIIQNWESVEATEPLIRIITGKYSDTDGGTI